MRVTKCDKIDIKLNIRLLITTYNGYYIKCKCKYLNVYSCLILSNN